MNRIFWIGGLERGRLAIAARPRGGDWLDDELASWQREGIHALVSLLTPGEEGELSLTEEAALARGMGLTFISLPIPDRQVPESESEVDGVVRQVDKLLRESKSVLIHCRQGIGRSSLLAACLLVHHSQTPEAALRSIAAARETSVPETAEQRQWIERYAAHIHAALHR